ncbi:MAG: hydroxymethylglutaryl-CoA lyase [Rhodoferax sp.]|nr:hydroxymethylglutaryl-CoA lyase [Actinomycetota bacterium]
MNAASVQVIEVGPRDGLQNEPVTLSVEQKVTYVESLVKAGLRRIEVVSFVNPARVPQMAGAEEVMAAVPRTDGVSYAGLVLNERGLDRALAAGVDEVNVVVVASETFSQRNQGASITESSAMAARVVSRAQDAGLRTTVTIAAAFGCPFEGEVPTDRVTELARRCDASGVDEIALADTIGVAVPADVRRVVSAVREVTGRPLRLHLHNTRNTGYANAITAVEMGVAALDASSGGIGGCPFAPNATGNIATEDLVYLLSRSGIDSGLALDDLLTPSALVAQLLGAPVPALLPRAGDFPGRQP